MSLLTPRQIVDAARVRHWAFSALTLGDGAALLFLRQRLATHLAQHGAMIDGLVGTSLEYTVPLGQPTLLITHDGAILVTNYGQQLVTSEGPIIPRLGAAYEDGWPVHLTEDGVPYSDFSEPPIAGDPFGAFGGTPGFPLPADMVRLIAVALRTTSDAVIPCAVVPEAQRHTTLPGRDPACFVSGNRLVPILPTATSGTGGTRWANVQTITISYVPVQQIDTLDTALNLPGVLAEALVTDLAEFFAMQAKQVTVAEKRGFSEKAVQVAAAMREAALDLLDEAESNTVQYRG